MDENLLGNGRVQLRAVEASDYALLRRLELGPDMLHRWRFGGSTPSPESYAAFVNAGVYSQYLVLDVRKLSAPTLLGLVVAYDVDLVHGWGYLAAAKFQPGVLAAALFLEGLGMFIELTFRTAPVRKLYLESPEFNLDSFASAIGTILFEEARIQGHRFYDGRYWDQVILSVSRERWSAFSRRVGPSDLG